MEKKIESPMSRYIAHDELTPADEINLRIERLRDSLERSGIGAALILQNTDLYYFSGTVQQSNLFIPVDGDPVLLVKKNVERARIESPLKNIVPISGAKEIPGILKKMGYVIPQRIGMEFDVIPAAFYLSYRSIFDKSELSDVSHIIRSLRSVKSLYEIGIMRKAAQLSDMLAGSVREYLKEGMPEIEFAGLVEARSRALGHQGVVRMRLWGSELYNGHIMAGPSAAVPSYLASPTGGPSVSISVAQGPGFRPIGEHEPVLVDYAFAYRGYISDHSRIFSIGDLPDDLMKAHGAMVSLQEMIKIEARPGVLSGSIFKLAMEEAASLGYGEDFMGHGPEKIRFVGHGVGLELDEYPFLADGQKMELKENMTIALEPKLVFPGRGVVGIENTFLVTGNGLEQLGRYSNNVEII